MPKASSSKLMRVTRARIDLVAKMRQMGFGLRYSNPTSRDTREMMDVTLPQHWVMKSSGLIQVIFDPEGHPRFLDFAGNSVVEPYFAEIVDPASIMERFRRLYVRHQARLERDELPPSAFELMAWMHAHKTTRFHAFLAGGDLVRIEPVRQSSVPPTPRFPSFTAFTVRALEAQTKENARS